MTNSILPSGEFILYLRTGKQDVTNINNPMNEYIIHVFRFMAILYEDEVLIHRLSITYCIINHREHRDFTQRFYTENHRE